MTSNITQQEIKYAVREITSKPDEKLIERVQNYFKFYPETLEQLTDEKFKQEFIAMLYNYNHLHSELMTSTIETEATGRIILEVLMKENGLNQEEINELLDRNCWRRVTQFSVKKEDFSDYGNYKKKKITWKDKEARSLSAEEVLNVINRKFEEAEKAKELEIKAKEQEERIEELEDEVWMEREEAEKALNTAMKWRKWQMGEVVEKHNSREKELSRRIIFLERSLLNEQQKANYWKNKNQELPVLPKQQKQNRLKKLKQLVSKAREKTKEKFQAFIVQKNK